MFQDKADRNHVSIEDIAGSEFFSGDENLVKELSSEEIGEISGGTGYGYGGGFPIGFPIGIPIGIPVGFPVGVPVFGFGYGKKGS
jgi:hypothetical protein